MLAEPLTSVAPPQEQVARPGAPARVGELEPSQDRLGRKRLEVHAPPHVPDEKIGVELPAMFDISKIDAGERLRYMELARLSICASAIPIKNTIGRV